MAKNSPKRIASNNRFNQKTYEQIRTNSRKDARRIDLIKAAAARTSTTYSSYILHAIDDALQRDGVRLDDLPPITSTEDGTTSSDSSSTT